VFVLFLEESFPKIQISVLVKETRNSNFSLNEGNQKFKFQFREPTASSGEPEGVGTRTTGSPRS